jgi:hypothetical protein
MGSFVMFGPRSRRRNREIENEDDDEERGRVGQPPRVKYRRFLTACQQPSKRWTRLHGLSRGSRQEKSSIHWGQVRYPDIEDSSRRASNQVNIGPVPKPFPIPISYSVTPATPELLQLLRQHRHPPKRDFLQEPSRALARWMLLQLLSSVCFIAFARSVFFF